MATVNHGQTEKDYGIPETLFFCFQELVVKFGQHAWKVVLRELETWCCAALSGLHRPDWIKELHAQI